MPKITAPTLKIIDRDHHPVGTIVARPGLRTYSGMVTRVSEKSIWTQEDGKPERLHREFDGRLPSIYKSQAPKDAVFKGSAPTPPAVRSRVRVG